MTELELAALGDPANKQPPTIDKAAKDYSAPHWLVKPPPAVETPAISQGNVSTLQGKKWRVLLQRTVAANTLYSFDAGAGSGEYITAIFDSTAGGPDTLPCILADLASIGFQVPATASVITVPRNASGKMGYQTRTATGTLIIIAHDYPQLFPN